ncbi:MAG: AraC family transcriptional regulator [Opitutae bacterium]|nr:AraC family transcriptional regulator [Opitutae bacterium]
MNEYFRDCVSQNFSSASRIFSLREAEQLLSQGSWHIKEVSHRLGFSSSQYFSTVFKRVTGVSPGEFLKKLKTQV